MGLLGLEQTRTRRRSIGRRVKALTRRLAEGWEDQYGQLTPLADLRTELQVQLYLMLQRPVRWDGGEPSDDERQASPTNSRTRSRSSSLGLVERRLRDDVRTAWQEAYFPLARLDARPRPDHLERRVRPRCSNPDRRRIA